jgi:hypothetical protein
MDLSQFVCLANTHLLRENLRVVYALLLKLRHLLRENLRVVYALLLKLRHLLREILRVVYAFLLKLCLRAMSPRWSCIQQQLKL